MNGFKLLAIVVGAIFVVAAACSSSSSEVASQPTPSPTAEVVSTGMPGTEHSEPGDQSGAVASGGLTFADGFESSFSGPPLTPEQARCASELIGEEITNLEDMGTEHTGEVLTECMGFSIGEGLSFANEELLACTSDLFGREVTAMSELTQDESSFAFEVCGPDLDTGIGGGLGGIATEGGDFTGGELPSGVTIRPLPGSSSQSAGQ